MSLSLFTSVFAILLRRLKIGKSKAFPQEVYFFALYCIIVVMKVNAFLDQQSRPARRAVPPVVDEHCHGLFHDNLSFPEVIHCS